MQLPTLAVLFFICAENITAQVTLSVNALNGKRPFYSVGLGCNIGMWTYRSYHPASSRDPRIVSVAREAGIRLIRYPAGAEADNAWFDRNNTTWWSSGNGSYTRTLRADFLNSIKSFADEIGAQLLIVANAKIDDPQMAADLVKYCNIDRSFNVKYFEIGNEPDLYSGSVTPQNFAAEVKRYSDAMKAVDQSIVISGPAITQPAKISEWLVPYMKASGTTTEAVTFHYYPLYKNQTDVNHGQYPSINNLLTFEYGTDQSLWHQNGCIRVVNRSLEEWPYGVNHIRDTCSPGAPVGITELSPTSGGGSGVDSTFAHAIWAADVLGRFPYYGADFVTQFLLQGDQSYAMVTSDFRIRPVWYTYVMYKRYFGDTLVETISSDEGRIAVWASTKKSEPGVLYIIVVNKDQADDITAALNITGLACENALARVLNAPSASSTSGASIDGIQADQNCSLPDISGSAVTVSGNTINYTFKAHSVTSIVVTGSATGIEKLKIPARSAYHDSSSAVVFDCTGKKMKIARPLVKKYSPGVYFKVSEEKKGRKHSSLLIIE